MSRSGGVIQVVSIALGILRVASIALVHLLLALAHGICGVLERLLDVLVERVVVRLVLLVVLVHRATALLLDLLVLREQFLLEVFVLSLVL